jgi:hypothetical protein
VQHSGIGIALDGVQHLARKARDEVGGRSHDRVGAQAMHRCVWPFYGNHIGNSGAQQA